MERLEIADRDEGLAGVQRMPSGRAGAYRIRVDLEISARGGPKYAKVEKMNAGPI